MESEDGIDTKQKRETGIYILHTVIFLTLLSLIMILLISGMSGWWGLIIPILMLLMLTNGFVWYTRRRSRTSLEKINVQSRVNLDVIDLPRVYDFYCPKCLYQTNEQAKLCPNCQKGKLSPTSKNLD